jgi:hypothetical protein
VFPDTFVSIPQSYCNQSINLGIYYSIYYINVLIIWKLEVILVSYKYFKAMDFTNAAKFAGTGAAIGSVFPGAGTAIGGVIGGAAGLAYDWFKKPGEEMKKVENMSQQQLGDLTSWYNQNYYKDYMDSAEARSSMSNLTEQVKKVLMGYDNQAVASGSTEESRLAAKTGVQSSMGDAMTRLAGLGTQRKAAMRGDYMNYSGLLSNQLANVYRDKAQGYLTQQSNLFNSVGDLAGALFAGKSEYGNAGEE